MTHNTETQPASVRAPRDLTGDEPIDLATYRLWHGQRPMSVAPQRGASAAKFLVLGEGCWVQDAAGRRYFDACAGIANVCLGYGRRDICDAMHQQATALPMACAIRHERPAQITVDYANALAAAAPRGLDHVRLTHMGSASVENALLLARQFYRNRGLTEKQWVISVEGSFHGTTLMTMAATGDPELRALFGALPKGFATTPKPHIPSSLEAATTRTDHDAVSALKSKIETIGPDRVAAVILEPVMGTRVEPLPHDYIRATRRLCDQIDALLIFDEIVTGFGRLGHMWATDAYGVTPDIVCLAKGITSGYATLGAAITNDRVFAGFDPPYSPHFANGSSTDGHPVACAAALQVLRIFDDEATVAAAANAGASLDGLLRTRLAENPLVGAIRSAGLILGLDIVMSNRRPATISIMRQIRDRSEALGVLVQHSDNVLILHPPLIISPTESDFVVDVLSRVLDDLAVEVRSAGEADA